MGVCNLIRCWIHWAVLLTLAIASEYSLANCAVKNLAVIPPSFPPFDVPADNFPVGTQISDLEAGASDGTVVNCETDPFHRGVKEAFATSLKPSAGMTWSFQGSNFTVFRSAVPGFGYAIGIKDPEASDWIPLEDARVQTFPAPGTNTNPVVHLGAEIKVWYIATGRLQTGSYSIPAEDIVRLDVETYLLPNLADHVHGESFLRLEAANIEVNAQACKVLNSNLVVDMDTLNSYFLKGVGSSGPLKNFSIGLDCDAALKLEMNVDAANAARAADGVVKLDAVAGAASGVGVQLLNKDGSTPIPLGQDYKLFETVEGQNSVDLSARYYQLDNVVKPGVANATVNYTFRYK